MIRLWATLPKDNNANGLGALEKLLMEDPDGEQLIIARVNRRRATIDDDSHETTPTARIIHAELVTDADQRAHALNLLRSALHARTGEQELPFPGRDE